MEKTSTPHAVLVSSPGLGHLIPILELGKRLAGIHSFRVTIFFITTQANPTSPPSYPGVDLVEIPAANIAGKVDPKAKLGTKIFALMHETIPAICTAIRGLESEPCVLIFDMFASEYISMARKVFRVPTFLFVTASAWFLALTVYCPVLDKEDAGEYVDQTEPLKIPSCKPVRPEDVVDPMLERMDQEYKEYRRLGEEVPLFDGVILNTWMDLERLTLMAFKEDDVMRKIVQVPVYEIGPLTRTVGSVLVEQADESKKKKILEWLDRQPTRSVIYVSFGSGGTPSSSQMSELAWGLELSQQRFVWVVRPPLDKDASGTYLGQGGTEPIGLSNYLPNGFTDQTPYRGLVVSKWAPQIEVLSHPSVGRFLTHCGWNSVLESIKSGVPMIAWPMYAEQRMNATMLAEELEVAMRTSELPAKKVIGREEIENLVRRLMEGKEGLCIRRRVANLQWSASEALSDGAWFIIQLFVKSRTKFVVKCLCCFDLILHDEGCDIVW